MADEVRPGVRVGDAERDSTAALLRRHATDGRLTLDELDERLRDAYAAKTVGELNVLLDDLPAIRTDVELIQPSSAPARRMEHSVDPAAARGGINHLMWASWASVNVVVFVIWLLSSITGDGDWNPWFLWVAGPWGAVLASREIQERARRRGLGR